MADLKSIMEWTFMTEVAEPEQLKDVLIEGENIEIAYKTVRDVAAVTNKRIIISDKQGMTGKKIETYSIPFKSIIMYSSENGGRLLDLNAELEVWTNAGNFKLKVKKGVDIRKLDKIIARHILYHSV